MRFSWLFVGLAVAGCEESLEEKLERYDRTCARIGDALVQLGVRCVGGPEPYHLRHVALTYDFCAEVRPFIETGEVELDRGAADDCIDVLGEVCDLDDSRVNEECLDFFRGTRRKGEACEVGCEEGLFCHPCDRVCVPLAKKGEACNSFFGRCDRGLVCDTGDTGTCLEIGALGEACTFGDCLGGAVCNLESNRCVMKAEGDACGGLDGGCSLDLACLGGPRVFSEGGGTCTRIAAVGETCASNQCRWPALCTSAGVCELAPWPGEPCEGRCVFGFCGDDGLCHEPLPVGAACEEFFDDRCDFRSGYCDGSVCTEYGGVCD